MNRIRTPEPMPHRIEICTHRYRTGWTYRLDVDNVGTFDTDRTYVTRQAAIEAAALRLIRELPVMFERDLIERVPCQLRSS